MSYYGSYDDYYAYEMIIEACQLADEDGVDFTQYDCNNDDEIDFVYVIYAGYGEADSDIRNTIWPHTYYVSYFKTVKLDGKLLNTYACGNEIAYDSKQHAGIGTFVHEFSHVLGLPMCVPASWPSRLRLVMIKAKRMCCWNGVRACGLMYRMP